MGVVDPWPVRPVTRSAAFPHRGGPTLGRLSQPSRACRPQQCIFCSSHGIFPAQEAEFLTWACENNGSFGQCHLGTTPHNSKGLETFADLPGFQSISPKIQWFFTEIWGFIRFNPHKNQGFFPMTEARTGLRDKAPRSLAGASLKPSNGNLLAADLVSPGWMSGYQIRMRKCEPRELRRKGRYDVTM